jgi:hypothetical protein
VHGESVAYLNHHILHSFYEFREGSPLQEYLRQRVSIFQGRHTLYVILTTLKIIIRDNLLFDENNPAMILGDPPLEAALGKREVYVREIQDIIYQQLVLTAPSWWLLSSGALAGAALVSPEPRVGPS